MAACAHHLRRVSQQGASFFLRNHLLTRAKLSASKSRLGLLDRQDLPSTSAQKVKATVMAAAASTTMESALQQLAPHLDFSLPKEVEVPGSIDASLQKFYTSYRELDAVEAENFAAVGDSLQGVEVIPEPSSAFVDMLLSTTENNATTFSSSGSAKMDFFFQVLEATPAPQIRTLLDKAWQESSLDTLQLIAHLRDIRHGKGETRAAYEALQWLRERHPLTLLANLQELIKVGYWKDLLNLLARQCVGEDTWQSRQQEAEYRKNNKGVNHAARKAEKKERLARWRAYRDSLSKEERAAAVAARATEFEEKWAREQEEADRQRREKRATQLKRAREVMSSDDFYHKLHFAIASLFADQLRHDLDALKSGKKVSSLAAKWAPSPARGHDKDTLIATTVALLLYPPAENQRAGESLEKFTACARSAMQKHYLAPLRAAAMVPETYMSARKWNELPYERVPSVCMKTFKQSFEYHDKERFQEYLADVKSGKKKISAGALKPHELVREAMQAAGCAWSTKADHSETSLATMEAQWAAYVQKLRESGVLNSCLAVCDVSGSMSGEPMEVAIALGLLTSELAAPPFNKVICTFSSQPELHAVKGESLVEKVQDVQNMTWQMNTNIQAVFELILNRAKAVKLAAKDMVSTIFIFSDMEFDQATTTHSFPGMYAGYSGYGYSSPQPLRAQDTNYNVVKSMFEAAGYQLPRIVFWNLQGNRFREGHGVSTPVTVREDGTALVSGFSGQLLKLFMESASDVEAWNEGFTPEAVLQKAIKTGHYDGWKVVD